MNASGITSSDLQVRCFLPVAGDPGGALQRFRGRPGGWLPGASFDSRVDGVMWLEVDGVLQHAHVRVGRPWSSGRTWWRSCCLGPTTPVGPGRRCCSPAIDAELALDLRPDGRLTVLLDGRVAVPSRPPGADGVGCRRAEVADTVLSARRTVDRLLAGCAAALAAERHVA